MSYTVLVMSCDKNINLLNCFFKYFYRFYQGERHDVVLGLETKKYSYSDGNIRVVNSCGNAWSDRLIETLDAVNTKAVLLLLDDFIIESVIDENELLKISRMIEEDDGIGHYALTTVPMKNISNELFFDRYYQRHPLGKYKTTLQAGMWNKNELLDILKEGESAWEVELFGNIRSYISERRYYAIAEKELKPIDYNDGWFCLQGKLNLLEKQRLEEKFSESFSILGMQDNSGRIERDRISLDKRILRRIKIGWLSLCFFIKAKKRGRI